ncbi:MAG: pantoate--beta-alanine ligase [Pseudomonadota bacterium]
MSLPIVRTVAELRAQVSAWRRDGLTVGLTPTMGALHPGHLSLVHLAKARADKAVATLFVNPTQFGENEDLDTYPRDEGQDAELLSKEGCDLLFAPSVGEMYPPDFSTSVRVSGLSDVLCGAHREGHFDGVAQVVAKLLNQAQADIAVFGEKDWQQLAIIRRMARDLDIPTKIVGAPIIREDDGLAMSSRNRYLSPEERAIAPELNRALRTAADRIASGALVAEALAQAERHVLDAGFERVDYVDARHAETLDVVRQIPPAGPGRVFGAAVLGKARLIDNVSIPETQASPEAP